LRLLVARGTCVRKRYRKMSLSELHALVRAGTLRPQVFDEIVRINRSENQTKPSPRASIIRVISGKQLSSRSSPVASEESNNPNAIVHEGWLFVRRGKESWKRRYVVLHYDHIEWAPAQNAVKGKEVFHFQDTCSAQRSTDDVLAIEVFPTKKSLVFSADSEGDVKRWLQHMRRVMEIVRTAKEKDLPVLLNRPFRSLSQVSRDWLAREEAARKLDLESEEMEKQRICNSNRNSPPHIVTNLMSNNPIVVMEKQRADSMDSSNSTNVNHDKPNTIGWHTPTSITSRRGAVMNMNRAIQSILEESDTEEKDEGTPVMSKFKSPDASIRTRQNNDDNQEYIEQRRKHQCELEESIDEIKIHLQHAIEAMDEAVQEEMNMDQEEFECNENVEKCKLAEGQSNDAVLRLKNKERLALDRLPQVVDLEKELSSKLLEFKSNMKGSQKPAPSKALQSLLKKDGVTLPEDPEAEELRRLMTEATAAKKAAQQERDRYRIIEQDRVRAENDRKLARVAVMSAQKMLLEASEKRQQASERASHAKRHLEELDEEMIQCKQKLKDLLDEQ
jgi:hypothetical protein